MYSTTDELNLCNFILEGSAAELNMKLRTFIECVYEQ